MYDLHFFSVMQLNP